MSGADICPVRRRRLVVSRPVISSKTSRTLLELNSLVAGIAVLVLVEPAGIALGRVVEQCAACPIFDGVDDVDGKVRRRLETGPIRRGVPFAVWIHQLSGGDLADELPKGRGGLGLLVDGFHLLRARDQTGLMATLAKLVDRDVLQLWQVDFVAQEV